MTIKTEVPQTLVGPLLQSFFMEHLCNHKRLSPQTVKSYRDTFRLLLQYLQAKMAKKPSALSIAVSICSCGALAYAVTMLTSMGTASITLRQSQRMDRMDRHLSSSTVLALRPPTG